jgi:hypothetical protein
MPTEPPTPDVFISHIHEEQGIAHVIQKYLKEAFGPQFRVFASSDQTSIGGGREWFNHILTSLKGARVVLVLLSDESRTREWINFEAGVGKGADACVIPVAIRQFVLGKLRFPLAGLQGRLSEDLEGLIHDIESTCSVPAKQVDRLEYLEELRKAEDLVTYKSVILRPYLESTVSSANLKFEIRNQGNTDIDLLHLDVFVETSLFRLHGSPTALGPRDTSGVNINGLTYMKIRLTALSELEGRLEPVLTRSMGWVQLPYLDLSIHGSLEDLRQRQSPIFTQVYARHYDTKRESIQFIAMPDRPAAESDQG